MSQLLAAARLAQVPLPLTLDGTPERITTRLATADTTAASAQLDAAKSQAADGGPAEQSLRSSGLLDDDGLDAGLTLALQVVAGGRGFLQIDMSAHRRAGLSGLRCWLGIQDRLVAQLATSGGESYEISWWDAALWHSQITRIAQVQPWTPEEPRPLASFVRLPTELMLGSHKALKEQRLDLLEPMAADHVGQVLFGDQDEVIEARQDEIVGLLAVLAQETRGRLRVLARRRDDEAAPKVLSWLLFDSGWHELAPGPEATTEFRHRAPGDLSVLLEPFAAATIRAGAR